MNKARLILTAIGVLAVVGGALAFKAKTFGEENVFCTTPGICTTTAWQTTEVRPISTTAPCGLNEPYYTEPLCEVPAAGTVYNALP